MSYRFLVSEASDHPSVPVLSPKMHWLCRQDMVEARVRRLPGYVERVELTRQKGPAFRLRQYASRVLGDMQLHDQVGSGLSTFGAMPPYIDAHRLWTDWSTLPTLPRHVMGIYTAQCIPLYINWNFHMLILTTLFCPYMSLIPPSPPSSPQPTLACFYHNKAQAGFLPASRYNA